MKKLLYLIGQEQCSFLCKQCNRVNSVQKEVTNQAFWLVNDQRKSQMANQIFCFQIRVHALAGVIYGIIFPWLLDMQVFLLRNHLKIFSCILLIGNHLIFLMQLGINKHL